MRKKKERKKTKVHVNKEKGKTEKAKEIFNVRTNENKKYKLKKKVKTKKEQVVSRGSRRVAVLFIFYVCLKKKTAKILFEGGVFYQKEIEASLNKNPTPGGFPGIYL